MRASPVDRAHLGRYTLGDMGLEREVLGLFLAQLPLTIESLQFAATDRDWQWRRIRSKALDVPSVHGVSRNSVLEAEKLGGIADREACRAIIGRIEAAAAEVESYFAAAFPD